VRVGRGGSGEDLVSGGGLHGGGVRDLDTGPEPGLFSGRCQDEPSDRERRGSLDRKTLFPPGPGARINLADYVVSYNVSTKVSASAPVVCERAMYGNNREWGTGATGVTSLSKMWYLAEGCTDGGMETWVLVQNPESTPVNVTLTCRRTSARSQAPKTLFLPGPGALQPGEIRCLLQRLDQG